MLANAPLTEDGFFVVPKVDRVTPPRLAPRFRGIDLTDLTTLTLAEARDALKSRAISSVEITQGASRAIERAKGAQRLCRRHRRSKALRDGRASDARLAEATAGPLEGLPIGVKDLYATKGVHTQACSHILDGFKPPYESTVTANLWRDGAVMLGKLNMDEFAMGSSNETSYYGPVASPWLPPNWSARQGARGAGRRQARPADARRLVGRFGVRGRRAPLSGRHRERHRRLDPPARGLHRHRRHQADLRALLALGHGRVRLVARSGRTARAHRARRRDHAALDGRARPEGFDLRDDAGSRLRSRGRPLGQGPDDRHSRANIGSTA